MRIRTVGSGFLLLAAALLTATCGDGDEEAGDTPGDGPGPDVVSVEMDDFYFEPPALAADAGETLTVTVQNEGKAEHTFTIDDLGVDQEIAPGETKTVTVESAQSGSLEFYCRYHHSQMSGTITVGSAGASAPTEDSDSGDGYYGY